MRTIGARLPPSVVVWMSHDVIPEWHLALKVFLIGVSYGTEVEIKLVAVRRLVVEIFDLVALWVLELLLEVDEIAERIIEKKRTVMMDVVSHEPIAHRRLR